MCEHVYNLYCHFLNQFFNSKFRDPSSGAEDQDDSSPPPWLPLFCFGRDWGPTYSFSQCNTTEQTYSYQLHILYANIYIYMFVTGELVMFHYVWSMLKGHKFWQYPAAICRSKTENGVEPALWGKHVPMQAGIYESWRFLTAARSTRHAAATVPTTSLCCDDTGQNHAISFACQLVN